MVARSNGPSRESNLVKPATRPSRERNVSSQNHGKNQDDFQAFEKENALGRFATASGI